MCVLCYWLRQLNILAKRSQIFMTVHEHLFRAIKVLYKRRLVPRKLGGIKRTFIGWHDFVTLAWVWYKQFVQKVTIGKSDWKKQWFVETIWSFSYFQIKREKSRKWVRAVSVMSGFWYAGVRAQIFEKKKKDLRTGVIPYIIKDN